MSKYYKRLMIGSLNSFAQAPHHLARMVLASHEESPTCNEIEHAGWLMPQVSEVHPKTARYRAHLARFAKGDE
jgi:hypothetical protein